ncbi:hypothetical protein HEQ62_08285 [Haematospirillum jordaniae]|nr:AGE family epimerase/isomerase [Haematospirillum jordaniae]NKD44989.1 hypothetical protein [Haematospirillum jordaniae]NKD57814.1 hypothetical protein [Haematospirillum jordaniae]NKD59775.1 hypothetical protein [Haematospirillum jordaniae]NKD67642.1 hypothetical protein [Haematospirillum jordaniae]NKD79806.1 hypothetical protein [Haematospirillum jordaniae]
MTLSVRSLDRAFMAGHLDIWAGPGWDRETESTVEILEEDGTPRCQTPRRVMALCRQLYVRCALYAIDPVLCRDQGGRLLERLDTLYADPLNGGWWFSIMPDGEAADRRKDLYAHAFVVLATAVAASVLGHDRALFLARRTMDDIRTLFTLPDRSWFAAGADPDGSGPDRRLLQNPHMHLFEAAMAFALVSGRSQDADMAHHLAALFPSLLHPQAGMIAEYFGEDGSPELAAHAQIEPGHQFEWAWLLHEYAVRFHEPGPVQQRWLDQAHDLLERGMTCGIDRAFGGVFNSVDAHGRVTDEGKRIWPLTELLKALAVLRPGQEKEFLDFLGRTYLRPGGFWIEACSRSLEPFDQTLRASTGYHLATAWQELGRMAGGRGVYDLGRASP